MNAFLAFASRNPDGRGWIVWIKGQDVGARITMSESVYTLKWGADGGEWAHERAFSTLADAEMFAKQHTAEIERGEAVR